MYALGPENTEFFRWPDPVLKPLEAVLVFLGFTLALFHWRRPEYALITLWWIPTFIFGSILTGDQPYLSRMVGATPLIPLAAGITLTQMGFSIERIASGGSLINITKNARNISLGIIGGAVIFLSAQNMFDYFVRYPTTWPQYHAVGFAAAVRSMNDEFTAEGRPRPFFGNVKTPGFIHWEHEDNLYLNYGTEGMDIQDIREAIPRIPPRRDLVFIVWPDQLYGLPLIQELYPGGDVRSFYWGRPSAPLWLTIYVVKDRQ